MVTKGTMTFHISMDWLTMHIRSLWAEGNYDKAIGVLDCLIGLSLDQKADVIAGKLKLTEKQNGSTVAVPDDWSPDLTMCLHGCYLTFNQAISLASRADNLERSLRRLEDLTIAFCMQRMREGPDRAHALFMLETLFDSGALKRNGVEWRGGYLTGSYLVFGSNERGWSRIPGYEPRMDISPEFQKEIDEFRDAQVEVLTKDELPPEDVDLVSEDGYITHDGKFWPCRRFQHIWLAGVLTDNVAYPDESRFVKIAASQVDPGTICVYAPSCGTVTAAQLVTVAQWCIRHEVELPRWANVKSNDE